MLEIPMVLFNIFSLNSVFSILSLGKVLECKMASQLQGLLDEISYQELFKSEFTPTVLNKSIFVLIDTLSQGPGKENIFLLVLMKQRFIPRTVTFFWAPCLEGDYEVLFYSPFSPFWLGER